MAKKRESDRSVGVEDETEVVNQAARERKARDDGRVSGNVDLSRRVAEQVSSAMTQAAAAAGVPHSRAALEALYLLPKDFLDRYTELFDASLKLAGMGPSEVLAKTGELGREPGNNDLKGTTKGLRHDSGANAGSAPHLGSGSGRRFRKDWVVLDDDALELKGRIDRRLRAIGRDIREELAQSANGGVGAGAGGKRVHCSGCGRIVEKDWAYCPHCGGRF